MIEPTERLNDQRPMSVPESQSKDLVSDDSATPEAQAMWIRRGERLGEALQTISAMVSRLWLRQHHAAGIKPGPHGV